jgi:hypothetical protein
MTERPNNLPVTAAEHESVRESLEARFQALSFVCHCRDGRECSACKEQRRITDKLKSLKAFAHSKGMHLVIVLAGRPETK